MMHDSCFPLLLNKLVHWLRIMTQQNPKKRGDFVFLVSIYVHTNGNLEREMI